MEAISLVVDAWKNRVRNEKDPYRRRTQKAYRM